jgi:hypothetical protein
MSEVTITPYSKLRFTCKGMVPDRFSIVPRLCFEVEISHIMVAGGSAPSVGLNYAPSELKVISREGQNIYTSSLVPEQPFYLLPPGSSISSRLYAELDPYRLAQVEKIREGRDLQIRLELKYIAEVQQQPPVRQPVNVPIIERIPKSDWVEIILPQMRFKEVSLLEIPRIEKPEFSEVIGKINEAWRLYSMGEYDKVLTECRKAMEALTNVVKGKGFQREVVDEKGKRTLPDWEKALGHKDVGEIVEVFVQKLFGFLAPGSHYGKSINKEDAELAIMSTHALANYIARKLPA